ncbi:methyltransferase domain-containing protein [Haloechinothrix sp. LS1_15]|uniref:class I SAM-dependent methyltransferase n=1 Tax=Haloechinothrix sp. LS1_15 TaxID=2652248 RepID=UPI0029455E0C|nr:methyltransferase domain-containing protein [Haloechinothrix sp. LS1_15]MDV6011109.1 methyltransferase domain-containing protein [Haloechinothrix sp. LS1_15]
MTRFAEYTDPRLVRLYDAVCSGRHDIDFYLGLAREYAAWRVVDIGCGTGRLACELAALGCEVTGVDPAPAMIEFARNRPGGTAVRWVEGHAGTVGELGADLAVMTGHVAQVIVDDWQWHRTLRAAWQALRPGGVLAFESRNPDASRWTAGGMAPESCRYVDDPVLGRVAVRLRELAPRGDLARSQLTYTLTATGDTLTSTTELRFRSRAELTRALAGAGFAVQQVYGDWGREPVTPWSPELIVVATRDG